MGDSQPAGQALGTWRNPPLAYVVAELAISAHYNIGARLGALQDALRDDFPRTSEMSEVVIAQIPPGQAPAGAIPTAQTPQPRWHLLNAENTRAVDISPRSIALHATEYIDSTDFLERFAHLLQALKKSGLDVFVERAGLRYIDAIVPTEGHIPQDYLIKSMHGPSLGSEGMVQSSIWSAAFSIDGSAVQLRTAAPAPNGMLLPPNLAAVPLKMPGSLVAAQQLVANQKAVGWIDTDAGSEIRQPLNVGETVKRYAALHQHVSRVFRSVLSDLARTEWE